MTTLSPSYPSTKDWSCLTSSGHWRADIDHVLLMQRRRTVEDELNMRSVYEEGDLISVRCNKDFLYQFVQVKNMALKSSQVQFKAVLRQTVFNRF